MLFQYLEITSHSQPKVICAVESRVPLIVDSLAIPQVDATDVATGVLLLVHSFAILPDVATDVLLLFDSGAFQFVVATGGHPLPVVLHLSVDSLWIPFQLSGFASQRERFGLKNLSLED